MPPVICGLVPAICFFEGPGGVGGVGAPPASTTTTTTDGNAPASTFAGTTTGFFPPGAAVEVTFAVAAAAETVEVGVAIDPDATGGTLDWAAPARMDNTSATIPMSAKKTHAATIPAIRPAFDFCGGTAESAGAG